MKPRFSDHVLNKNAKPVYRQIDKDFCAMQKGVTYYEPVPKSNAARSINIYRKCAAFYKQRIKIICGTISFEKYGEESIFIYLKKY